MKRIERTHKIYRAAIQTISPVHIGADGTLKLGIDIIDDTRNRQVHRLNTDAILSDLFTPEMFERSRPPLPVDIIASLPEAESKKYYLYSLDGTMRAQTANSQLREFIKTPDFKPYIPGSTVKGALRTALAWAGWSQVYGNQKLSSEKLKSRAKFAGQDIEHELFAPAAERGRFPNYDLMRALQVSDFHLKRNGSPNWRVLNVQVAKLSTYDSPIEVEAIDGSTIFNGRISIDRQLLRDNPFPNESGLGLKDRRYWLEELIPNVNSHSLSLLEGWAEHFRQSKLEGAPALVGFFEGLVNDLHGFSPEDRICILPIGWGTGWDSKTFGSRLQGDARIFEELVVNNYRLHRAKSSRKPGDNFPLTRRVAVEIDNNGQPARIIASMGWVKLVLREIPESD